MKKQLGYKQVSLYEKICNFFDKLQLPLPKRLEEKYLREIEFCHLQTTPKGVFLTAIFIPLISFILINSVFLLFNAHTKSIAFISTLFSLILFYYLFRYTHFLTIYFRSKAASEMTLSIVYMAMSLRITQNLENAVAFAASNLSGPLGLDLKKMLWDIQTGTRTSVIEAIDWLARKWRAEAQEFVDALSLLKTTTTLPPDRASKNIDEAVELMLYSTKERMKRYAREIRGPIKIINMFGILLPILCLILFPIISIFVPEVAKPDLLAFLYIFFLPSVVFLFMRQYFYHRPYSFHQVEIEKLAKFKREKKILSIATALVALLITFYLFFSFGEAVTFEHSQFLNSLYIILTIGFSIVIYSLTIGYMNLQKNREIIKIENELPVALFQLSTTADFGKPIESVLADLEPRIKQYELSKFFKKIRLNILQFSMTLERAIFDKKYGVINKYPSKMLRSVMKTVVDLSKRGMVFLASALKSMSKYLSDAVEVDNTSQEILAESVSDMQIQSWLFAPITAGVIVGMMAMVLYIFTFFGSSFENLEEFFRSAGAGKIGISSFSFIFNIGKQIPFHYFQLIVGLYMIEIVYLISHFLGGMIYGDDEISKLLHLGKTMLIAVIIYSVSSSAIYFGVSSLINLSQLGLLT